MLTIHDALDVFEQHADTLAHHNDKLSLLSSIVAAADARHVQAKAEYDRLLSDATATTDALHEGLRAVRRTRLVLDEFAKRQRDADDHRHVARETFERKAGELVG